MSFSTLAPPPSEVHRTEPEAEVVRRARPVLSPAWIRPRVGRAVVWLSVVVHLAVLALFIVFLRLGSPIVRTEAPPSRPVQYFDLDFPGASAPVGIPAPSRAAAAAPTAAPGANRVNGRAAREESEPLVFPNFPSNPEPGAATGGAQAGAGAENPSGTGGAEGTGEAQNGAGIGDRLRPGYRDSRLYVDQKIEELKKTDTRSDIEKYRERLRSLIEASNDSAWAQGSHPNTDWTVRDRDGRKWGVDEKGVHLGGITIPKALVPNPRATGTNEKIEAERQKEKDRQAIQAQEAARDRKEAQDRAIRETRARKEAERKKAAEDGGN